MKIDIKEIVTEKIKTNNDEVKNRVVDFLYEKQIGQRVTLVIDVLEKLEKAEKELSEIKPDDVNYDIEGKPVTQLYTKSGLDKLNKAKGEVKKYNDALDKAIGENDFNLLEKIK